MIDLLQILVAEFQSTPSAWRETLCYLFVVVSFAISIHSLRMEGDIIIFGYFIF